MAWPLADLSYFPLATLHLSFCCGFHQNKYTGVRLQISSFLLLINIKEAQNRIQGISFPNFPFFFFASGESSAMTFLPTVFQILGQDSKLWQDCTPSPPPKLPLYYRSQPRVHLGKTSPFQTSTQHRQHEVHFCGEDPVQTTYKYMPCVLHILIKHFLG